jgi:hypothetical protein
MQCFHNTVGETGTALARSEAKAKTQEEKVLAFYSIDKYHNMSPSYVHSNILPYAPLTSVRRAISNLTKQGKLVKTKHMVDGPYGKKEYCWRLA